MRYAVISDIHANKSALKAVLTDAHDMGAEKIICLGDVLGYGPEPVETLESVYREVHICLAGNHDDAASSRFPTEDFTEFAASAIEKHKKLLTREALDWLRHLPYSCSIGDFACSHGDFSDPKNFNYIISAEDAIPSWKETSEHLLFVGHTHEPKIFTLSQDGSVQELPPGDFSLSDGVRYIVNPGSVGYPRHGMCRSSYCIYDDVEKKVYFRSLPFDLESYRLKMHGRGIEEAPWLDEKTRERRRPAVRSGASFGKTVPAENIDTDKSASDDCKRIPEKRSSLLRKLVYTVLTAAIATAISFFCLKEPASPEKRSAESTSPAIRETESEIRATIPLAGGWSASIQNPEDQSIRIERNYIKDETVWRIEHSKMSAVHFSKTIPMEEGAEKIHTNIRLLSRRREKDGQTFRFTSRLVFKDKKGKILREELASGKVSRKSSEKIPSQTSSIEFIIDCMCCGKFDLAIPHFDFKEEKKVSRKRRKQ